MYLKKLNKISFFGTSSLTIAALLGCLASGCDEAESQPTDTGDAGADESSTKEAEVFLASAIEAEDQVFTSEELVPHFDRLDPVDPASMIGTWKGGKFDGGKPDPIDWWGKQVQSLDEALGFLCERADGTIYSWEFLGRASIDEVEFHGVSSAALVYDNGFMTDYFRRVSDDVVVGYSPVGYGDYEDLFFHLTRVEDFDVE